MNANIAIPMAIKIGKLNKVSYIFINYNIKFWL
jgi:hypothetical protein